MLKKIKKKEERRRKGVEEMVDVHKRFLEQARHVGPHIPHIALLIPTFPHLTLT